MTDTRAQQIKDDLAVIGRAIGAHTPAPQPLRELGNVAGYVLNSLAAQPSAGAQAVVVAWRWKLLGSWAYTDSPSRANLERSLGETLYPLYATPAQPDTGYTDAFYQLAEMMGLPASPQSPRTVWETVMRPRLQELLAKPDTGDVAALREALERIRDETSDMNAHEICLAALSKPNAPGAA